MPFVVPIIGAALGVGAIGQAVIGLGLSLGLGMLARRLAPKPRDHDRAGGGMRLSLRLDPNAEREVVLGTAATAGTLVTWNLYGPNGNDTLQLAFALADHECTSLERIWVDGVEKALGVDAGSGHTVADYPNMLVKFHSGAWSQDADAGLVAQAGANWSTDNRGRGVCYVVVTMTYDENVYKSGQPRFLFEIKGAKLYDWREDSTAGGSGSHRWGQPATYEWTDNPVVCAYNWRRGILVDGKRLAGMSTSTSQLPLAHWTAAANACDETVGKRGGGTEKRYRCGGVIAVNQDNRSVLTDLVTAYAGFEVDTGGVIVPKAGVAQVSVASITDDDLITDGEVEVIPRLPRSDLTNAVFGTFNDPAQVYEAVSLPPRISPDDETLDGGTHLPQHYALDLVGSQSQGQRCLEIFRRRDRWQKRVRLKLRSRFAVLEAGDWITWDSDRYGITDGTFEVMSATLGSDLTVTVQLREVSASIYDWEPDTDELDVEAPGTVPSGGSSFTQVADLDVTTVTITGPGGSERPGLRATWEAITDRTVVAVDLEYRIQGDTAVLSTRSEIPGSGSYTWISGVQGNAVYEVRARPVTLPERATSWTGWVSTAGETEPQIVEIAQEATSVPPDTITSDMLDAQARFELSLTTAVDEVMGSTAQQLNEAITALQKAGASSIEALIGQHKAHARITIEQQTREDEDAALAALITTVQTALDDNVATVTEILTSIDGIEGTWSVSVDINGNVVGLVKIDGTATESTFDVVADKFRVALPGITGGGVVPVFEIADVDGTPKLVLKGDMIADGGILARSIDVTSLSAIVADIGTITAGKLQRADGTMVVDLDAKQIKIVSS